MLFKVVVEHMQLHNCEGLIIKVLLGYWANFSVNIDKISDYLG